MRRTTLALCERILTVAAAVLTVAWCLLALLIALSYQGTTAGSTWIVRGLLLALGAFVTNGFLHMAARAWRSALAQPLPGGRASSWLAAQPGWRLAIGFWLLYSAPELGTSVWRHHGNPGSAGPPELSLLFTSVIGASLLAMLFRVVWQHQLENSSRLAQPGDLSAAVSPSR